MTQQEIIMMAGSLSAELIRVQAKAGTINMWNYKTVLPTVLSQIFHVLHDTLALIAALAQQQQTKETKK